MTDNTKAAKTRQRKPKGPFSDELLDQLLAQVHGRDAESLLGESGLVGQLKKQLAERMLSAELNHQLATERAAARRAKSCRLAGLVRPAFKTGDGCGGSARRGPPCSPAGGEEGSASPLLGAQSSFIPACLTILPQRAISDLRKSAKNSGVLPTGSRP